MAKTDAKKKPLIPVSTIVAFVVLIPVAFIAFRGFTKWQRVRNEDASFDKKLAELQARNQELGKVWDVMQMQKFELANKQAGPVTVHWVAAAYHDGNQIKVFDSTRCRDFKEIELAPGDNKTVNLASSQEGCNWNGQVFYYALRYTFECGEKLCTNTMIGPYRGFDRDVYTFK